MSYHEYNLSRELAFIERIIENRYQAGLAQDDAIHAEAERIEADEDQMGTVIEAVVSDNPDHAGDLIQHLYATGGLSECGKAGKALAQLIEDAVTKRAEDHINYPAF